MELISLIKAHLEARISSKGEKLGEIVEDLRAKVKSFEQDLIRGEGTRANQKTIRFWALAQNQKFWTKGEKAYYCGMYAGTMEVTVQVNYDSLYKQDRKVKVEDYLTLASQCALKHTIQMIKRGK